MADHDNRKSLKGRVSSQRRAILSMLALAILVGMTVPARGAVIRESDGVFSIEFRNADLKEVLRALSQETGTNLILDEAIQGRVTLSFQDVTLDQALDAILKIQNLTAVRDGNIVRIVRSPFAEGEANLVTRVIALKFGVAKETAESIRGLLSQKGSLTTDLRTNTIIVRDVPENVEHLADIARRLDTRTPQVMIEARIVEVSTDFRRELGVQWGGSNQRNIGSNKYIFYGAGGTRPSSTDPIDPLSEGIGISGSGFAVNLPAAVGSGSGGAFDVTYGTLSGSLGLDLQLSALEDTGRAKILSSPRILTLNNKEARISTGTEIFIPSTSIVTGISSGTSGTGGQVTSGVTTINAKLELAVTPHVTPDGQILMHVRTDKKDPDFSRSVQNIPPLSTRSAETDLLVKDGETIVIGGIYTKSESFSENGLPWISRIPIIKWLFTRRVRVENQNELLIFITPQIHEET